MPRLSMVYDVIRWEEKAILEAARRKGADFKAIDIKDVRLDLRDGNGEGFGDIALQRCVSYFRGLHATAALEGLGLRVVNDLHSILVAGNKLLTTFALRKAGVPVPRSMLTFTLEGALDAVERLGYPALVKPTIGGWGHLVSLLKDRDSARAIFEHREELFPLYHVYYLQEWVNRPPRDIRAFVLGDRVVAAIYRVSVSGDWRTNTARGGKAVECPITPELEELCLKAVRAVGEGFYGVDLMEGPEGLLVHEVNNTTEFKNTVPATGVDIPGLLIDYLTGKAKG